MYACMQFFLCLADLADMEQEENGILDEMPAIQDERDILLQLAPQDDISSGSTRIKNKKVKKSIIVIESIASLARYCCTIKLANISEANFISVSIDFQNVSKAFLQHFSAQRIQTQSRNCMNGA